MAVVGTVNLLVFGFDSQRFLSPDVVDRIRRLGRHGVIRLLEVLYVSKDMGGKLSLDHQGADLDANSPASTLWQLLDGNDFETPQVAALELHSCCEVGLDLTAAESLASRIEPGSSALLVLVETRWATDLLDDVITSGGFPIVFGCLEPETMLIIGPQLAATAEARTATELTAAAHGVATLESMATAPEASTTVAANVIRALVVARIIDPADVDDTIMALADAGLAPSSSVGRDPPASHHQPSTGP
jgi:uncharacterized membrane protein